jgi:hypothetical protein
MVVVGLSAVGNAWADEGEACLAPSETATCTVSMVSAARVRRQTALDNLKARYAERQELPAGDLACYLAATDFVVGCEGGQATCRSFYGFTVQADAGQGWSTEREIVFTGPGPGHCTYSESASDEYLGWLAPGGQTVLVSSSRRMGGKGRLYLVESAVDCHTEKGSGTERRFEVGADGLVIIDWDEGPVSNHWGRRADPLRHGEGKVEVRDEKTLRYSWPNGAYVDFSSDARPSGSNFLDPGAWASGSCRTGMKGAHLYPQLEALPDQKFGRVAAGFLTH